MQQLLREYIREILNELRWDREMLDLFKGKMKTLSSVTPIDALHAWLWNAGLAEQHGNDLALNLDKISEEEYEAMKRYVIPRYQGLMRQYRRSKDPAQSAISALNYYIANYYNAQIASGLVKRRLHRSTKPMRAVPGQKQDKNISSTKDNNDEPSNF
jgi:hypothetical protein